MFNRIVFTIISGLICFSVTAQSDSTAVTWAIDVDLGYGTILGSNGKPPYILCIEGCTPLSSSGNYQSKRLGLVMEWNDNHAISISGALVDFEFERLYRDDFLGGTFGDEWDIRYLDLQLAFLRTFISTNKWTGRAELGASYAFGIKESERLPATARNTINVSIGGRIDYRFNNSNSFFARIIVAHSLRNNLEYAADVASLKVDKFAPLFVTLGIQFYL